MVSARALNYGYFSELTWKISNDERKGVSERQRKRVDSFEQIGIIWVLCNQRVRRFKAAHTLQVASSHCGLAVAEAT